MKKLNLKKAAIVGMCCTVISTNTVFAIPLNSNFNNSLPMVEAEGKYILNLDEVIYQNKIIKAKEGIEIKLNGQLLQISGNPFIENDRILVQIMDIIEKLGAKAEINTQNSIINIYTDKVKIELKIDDNTAKIIKNTEGVLKEEVFKLDAPAKKLDDKIYVPVRFIAETLGAKVKWNGLTREVIIETDNGEIVTVERPIKFEIEDKQVIMDNELLSSWYQDNFKTKGIFSIIDGEWMYVMASAGEKSTGGYSLQIDSITEVTPGTAYIHATLKSPTEGSIVTQALTYPNAIVKFKTDNIEHLQWDLSEEKQQDDDAADKNEIKNLVKEFGKKLQMVSLLAPKDILNKSLEESYGNFVSPELLEKWQSNPQKAPGRAVSSPWPDHINILSANKLSELAYEVKGEIIEITSTEIKDKGIAAKRQITLTVKNINNKWLINDVVLGNYEELDSVLYENTEYGFNFSLPKSWKGYSIVTEKWEGVSLDNSQKSDTNVIGQILNIRHPQWTADKPRQDIPIMLFTLNQWELIQREKLGVGAAPIPPTELGRNNVYVFALPARYNYAFPAGYEEVEKIIEKKPLQAFEIE